MVYSRRCESRRGGTRRYEERRRRGRLRGWCARFPPVSFPLPRSWNLFSPCNIRSPLLSPFLSPRRGSRLKTRSKSRRRVASSRFGDSKEGRFSFQPSAASSISVVMLVRPDCISRPLMTTTSPEPAVIRRETPGPISRTPALFRTRELLFGSRIRVALFRTYLVSSFLPPPPSPPLFFSRPISLAIVHLATFSPRGLQRAESELSRFAALPAFIRFPSHEGIVTRHTIPGDSKFPRVLE